MTEDVRNSIGVLISGANREGNISFLEEQEANGELNPLLITEYERWNYLHRVNIYCSAPIETMNFYISKRRLGILPSKLLCSNKNDTMNKAYKHKIEP